MSDLVSWLEEQITEDETRARAVTGGLRTSHLYEDLEQPALTISPARVLAECAAKRKIIEVHEAQRVSDLDPFCNACGCPDCAPSTSAWPCPTLRILASVYADRPGYQPEWAL